MALPRVGGIHHRYEWPELRKAIFVGRVPLLRSSAIAAESPEPVLRVIRQLLAGVAPAFVIRSRTAWNVQFPCRIDNDE